MDDDLATGVQSPSMFSNEQPGEAQKEATSAQLAEIQKIMPSVEWMRGKIQQERAAIHDFHSYMAKLGPKPKANELFREYDRREAVLDFLNRLDAELTNKVANAQEIAENV